MRKYNIVLFFVLSALIVLAGSVLFTHRGVSTLGGSNSRFLARNTATLSQINLADDYKKYAANIVSLFRAESVDNSEGLPTRLKEAKNNLIALTVPKELAETHLTLVISLGLMERGLESGDRQQYDEGEKKFEQLLEENSWLLP